MKSASSFHHLFIFSLAVFFTVGVLSAQTVNLPPAVSQNIEKASSTDEAISIIRKALSDTPTPTASQKVQLLAFLASLLEQTGQYQEAQYQYSLAANASATVNNAAGRGTVASPEYLLGAVRCALSSGDTVTADYVLSTAFFEVSDQSVIAQVKLYAVWSWLCKIDSEKELQQPITALKSFLSLSSMKPVKPSVLLTLWYLTGASEYAVSLQKEFPQSTECAVVQGDAQVMPNAFWYFLPVTAPSVTADNAPAAVATSTDTQTVTASSESSVAVHWQLGFFKNREYAQDLVNRVEKAGFAARIREEKRPSGATYFSVLVDENESESMGQNLKNAGFECYPVYE